MSGLVVDNNNNNTDEADNNNNDKGDSTKDIKHKFKKLSVNIQAEVVDDCQKPQVSPRWLAPNHVKTAALLHLYASVHMEGKKNDSLFFRKATSTKAVGFKFVKAPIKEPLHFQALGGSIVKKGSGKNKTLEGLRASALENFKYIMFYMKDITAKEAELGAAAQHMTDEVCRSKISQAGLTRPELRDELFVQLIKQTNENPNADSKVRGWQLIACCANVYKPSEELFPAFFRYVHDHCFVGGSIGALAVYTLRQLMKPKAYVATPSARHQQSMVSNYELGKLEGDVVCASPFAAPSIGAVLKLEEFVAEVHKYKEALQAMGNILGMTSTSRGSGKTVAAKFANVSESDVDLVTKGACVHIKGVDQTKYRKRYVWVPETLDGLCWNRGDKKNTHKYKIVELITLSRCERGPPEKGFVKGSDPYLFLSLIGRNKDRANSMDFKFEKGSTCEEWTKSLRDLLDVSNSSAKARQEAASKRAGNVLPTAFKVSNAGESSVNGVYRARGKVVNGSRVYKCPSGYVMKKVKMNGKHGWVIEDVNAEDESKKNMYFWIGNNNVPEEFGWEALAGGKVPVPIVKETQFSRRASAIASAAAAAAAVQMGLQSTDSHDEDFRNLSDDEGGKDSRHSMINYIGWENMFEKTYDFHTENIPVIVQLLCKAVVRLGGFNREGIFRLAGSVEKVELARKNLEKRDYSDIMKSGAVTDALVAADLLKQWLRAMEEPLVEYKVYNHAVDCGNRRKKEMLKDVLLKLSIANRCVLLYLACFFNQLSQNFKVTKMGTANLAIVIMPNIVKSNNDANPAMQLMNVNGEKDFVTMLFEEAPVLYEEFKSTMQCKVESI